MTNEEIIYRTAVAEGYNPMDTFFHTFQEWKRMGFIVKKGEKATLTAMIWMPKKKKAIQDQDDDNEPKKENGFYLKQAYFFTQHQVQMIEEAKQ